MRKTESKKTGLQGDLYFVGDGQRTFAASQVQLLESINQCGSISSAAKRMGISYKTAWDRIDAMNNMSPRPLVSRSAGGARGGGTSLTDYGRKIVDGFRSLQQEHDLLLQRFGNQLHSFNDVANFMKTGAVRTSARNQFHGVITGIFPGAVNAEVLIDINASQPLVAMVTNESIVSLGLEVGASVIALVKASWILLSTDTKISTSARNKLTGTISRIESGAVNCDVTIDIGEGKSIGAVVTETSRKSLGLKEGDAACALFKASSVIVMV